MTHGKHASLTVWLVLGLLGTMLGANAWLLQSRFVPILQTDRVEYLLLGAPLWRLVGSSLGAFVLLVLLHAGCTRFVFRTSTWSQVGYLQPLALFALTLVALLNLIPGAYGWLFAWTYLSVDLWPWLAVLFLLCLAVAVGERARDSVLASITRGRVALARQPWRLELLLVAITALFIYCSSPTMRFDAGLHGDEPKYLRYCENWYQGRGFELSGLATLADLPVDYQPPILRNLRLLAESFPEDWREARSDLRRLARGGFGQRFNRATYLGNWFVQGKNGGDYQIHTPGISFLIFPAYAIDRYFLTWQYPEKDPRFPKELLASSTLMFLLYLVYAVAVFRFLRDYSGSAPRAFVLTLIAMLTLPLANFPFQFYPEVAAGVAIIVVTRWVLFGSRDRAGSALAAGLLTGYLPWLHVRFLSIVVLMLAGVIVSRRRNRTAVLTFSGGLFVALALLSLYAYHVTGSALPSALYDAREAVLHLGSIGPGLFGFLFDRRFGVLAHAPILIVAFLGVSHAIRRRPGPAGFCGLLLLTAAATAASHDFMAAATTPGRYLVSVLPIAMIGLSEAFDVFRSSKWFGAFAAVLLTISLQTTWTYNFTHNKSVAPITDASISGWKMNLLFPDIHGHGWEEAGFSSGLLAFWLLVCGALVCGPVIRERLQGRRGRQREPASRVTGWSYAGALSVVLALVGCAGTGASLMWGRTFDPSYLMAPQRARVDILRTAVTDGYSLAASSTGRRVRRAAIFGRPLDAFDLEPTAPTVRVGERFPFFIRPVVHADQLSWGTVELDFGDGQTSGRHLLAETLVLMHGYDQPGYYEATARLAAGEREVVARATVAVTEPPDIAPLVDASDLTGFPAHLAAAPGALTIRQVTIGLESVCADAPRPSGSSAQLWIATRTTARWETRVYDLAENGCVTTAREPERAHVAAFVVTTSAPSRSDVLVTYWPERAALVGPPVLASPSNDRFWRAPPQR